MPKYEDSRPVTIPSVDGIVHEFTLRSTFNNVSPPGTKAWQLRLLAHSSLTPLEAAAVIAQPVSAETPSPREMTWPKSWEHYVASY